jgi:ADP-heptose:LPS heptosyltransferase
VGWRNAGGVSREDVRAGVVRILEVMGRLDGVNRIGVLTASGIGDFIVTLPALHALRSAYPDAHVTVLGDSWHADFLEGRPGPWNGAVAVPRDEGVCRLAAEPDAPIHRFVAEHQGRYDLIVQMHGGGRESNPVVRALRPRWAVGSCTPGSAALDRCIPYVPGRPEILRWLEVVELAGAEPLTGSRSLTPTLPVTSADVEAAAAAWPHAGPVVLLHVGARDTRRRWSAAKFASVASALRARTSSTVLLVGTDRDHCSSTEVVRLMGEGAVDLTGQLSLGGTLGLARRSLMFLGNDSGPRHLAAAAGTPTVAVFWGPNVMSFGPLAGAANRVLVSYTVACPTCGQEQIHDRCEHDVSFVDSVTTEEVLRACEEVLGCRS